MTVKYNYNVNQYVYKYVFVGSLYNYITLFNAPMWNTWGTQWRGWLGHCTTSWKGAGLTPDGVIRIFH